MDPKKKNAYTYYYKVYGFDFHYRKQREGRDLKAMQALIYYR